ncbi:Uncharacterized protein dnl_01670 [Desulfonema limicola]|uniref:Uncharacterized protein n=1 Tax=Desulfonema limicola TaxID=45656 RepID=A0A975B388_9BACT|nr:hypothetical protein [Desulfonema limicola]QTA77963.1 Uncharacterized protein dnl_01670 [Desulfonema limicola]
MYINSIANIFITGVLPITIDDLASGFKMLPFSFLHYQIAKNWIALFLLPLKI